MSTESNLHTSRPLESRETHALIGSDKVEGTAVYRSNGDKIGQIARVMIGKQSGKVGYAVMSFGGFLGIGEDYYPLPWSLLTYSPRLEGYEVNLGDAQLEGAPKYGTHENWDWDSRARCGGRKTWAPVAQVSMQGIADRLTPSPSTRHIGFRSHAVLYIIR